MTKAERLSDAPWHQQSARPLLQEMPARSHRDRIDDFSSPSLTFRATNFRDARLTPPTSHIRVFAERPALGFVGFSQVEDRLELGLFIRPLRAVSERVRPPH